MAATARRGRKVRKVPRARPLPGPFYDEDIRFEYLTAFRKLTSAFNKALPRAEALDYFKTHQRLSAINEMASHF
jgi:hypothetical protein